jgi:predicted transcriptional regulator
MIMSAKEVLVEVAEKLPPDATLVDAINELEFRQAVEEGLAQLDRGERISLDEARKRVPQWISKYSSPKSR